MTRRFLQFTTGILLVAILIFYAQSANAQNEIYANQLVSNSSDFYRPERAVDASQSNYAKISTLLGVLASSDMRVRLPQKASAGDVVNVTVQGSGALLSADVLDNITIKLYDSAGTTPVATASGSSLLGIKLLTPGTNVYNIRFFTDVSKSYKFKEIKIELNTVLSLSLTEFRIYGFYVQKPCPPVYADEVTATGATDVLSLGYVTNATNLEDSNPDNYATIHTPISLLGLLGGAFIEMSFPKNGKAGDYVGFTVANSSGLLDLDVLGGSTVIIYDETGAARETRTGSSLLNLKLLAGSSNRYTLGFLSTKASYRIAKIRIKQTAVASLLSNLRVYNAFYYTIDRPPVTVTTNGPTTFCEGGSVTLSAYDSSGSTNYLWSNGSTSSSITVSTSGTYTVEVTDSASCSRRSIPIGVEVNPNPKPIIRGDSVLCLGLSGSLNLGGATFVSQLWSSGATTATINSIIPGKYFVMVTDTNACSGTDTISVIQNKLNISSVISPSTCSNTSNGSISLTVSGGSGSYSYRWSDGSAASSISSKRAGLYTCMVTDNIYNCSYNKSFSITSSNTLSSKIASVNTSGCAKSDGKVDLSIIGGGGTYAYSWSNGATTKDISNIAAGVYKINITDAASGCSISDTVAIGDGGNSLVITPSISNASSCSSPDGAISLSVSGGSGSYTYSWSTGSTASSVTGLSGGNYYVVVKDVSSNCSKALSIAVGNSGSFTINATIVKPGCKQKNGSISISSVSGGSSPYTYAWSTGGTSSSIASLQAGTYLLTVTDAKGCSKQEVFAVSDSSGPAATLAVSATDCGTNSNGAITVTASGSNNVYAWSNGANTKDISSLKPGFYTLTITDTSTNCVSVYQAAVSIKSQLDVTASPASNTSCAAAADGAVAVTVSGGTAPYTYSWSSGESTKDLSGKTGGTYTLTVTDATSCVTMVSVPILTDSSKLLKATVSSITKASCNTATNGAAAVTVSGGKTPYSYSWSPGGATTKDLSNVTAGVYTLTVTDAAGCTTQLIANISIDSTLAIKGTVDSTKASGCASSASGAAYVSISGGATPYTYQWRKGGITVATTKNLTGVTAGSYTLTVTDANGCTLSLNATVGVLPSGVTVVLDSLTRPSCNVSADGKLYTTTSGGSAPYTYLWSNGSTTEDITNANPGTLILTATDAVGCSGQLTVNLTYDTSKTLIVKADSSRGAGCLSGKSAALYITASGGTSPYVYAWTDGSTMSDLLNVVPGTYTATVTDARGCKASLTSSVGVDTSLSIKTTIDSLEGAGCVGSKSGKIYLSVSRGVAPYTYLWSNGATTEDIMNAAPGAYSVLVTDGAGCNKTAAASIGIDVAKKIIITADSTKGASCLLAANGAIYVSVKGGQAPFTYSWSNGATTANLTNVVPGFYTLSVLDANGCSGELSASVGVDAAKAIVITATAVKDAGCSGNASGSINVSVSGGVAPYTYLWSNGKTTRDITGLVPGSYTLFVKDAAACSQEFSTNIKVDTGNLIKITTASVQDAKCSGSSSGSVTVTVSGGVPPYTYSWSNGATTKDLSYIPAGSYLLNVTDAIGCTSQLSVNVGINNSNPVIAKLDSVKNVGCVDSLSGAVFVSVSGGTTPYTYLWSNGAITQYIVNVGKGAYLFNVTDDAGCSDNLSANVGTASPITVSAEITAVACNGGNNGIIALKVSGGSGLYFYKWTDGSLEPTRSGLAAGTYSVKVTDAVSGCFDNKNFVLTQSDSLNVAATIVKDSCLPGFDGAISVLVSGGVKPYSYTWSNGGNSDLIQQLEPKNYTLTVTDSRGCSTQRSYTVSSADCDRTINIHDVITPNGDGMNDSWIIEGIEYYANNQVQIVDKWGDLVYEKRPYDNSFKGFSSLNGNELPSGTYYYVLRLNEPNRNGGEETFKGALLIKR